MSTALTRGDYNGCVYVSGALEPVNLRSPGRVLLISCYELGHTPHGVAAPLAVLEKAGYCPAVTDIAVESLDTYIIRKACFVGISAPMHTALRLALRLAQRIRNINPLCAIAVYGLYASLNAAALLDQGVDYCIGGSFEVTLLSLLDALAEGRPLPAGVSSGKHIAQPEISGAPAVTPQHTTLPGLARYAHLDVAGEERLVGYVEASRGCKHLCRHCPIPPVYGGKFFLTPVDVVMDDIGRQVASGAQHITFGDADFLNSPAHATALAGALCERFPAITFDVTAKIEHIVKSPGVIPLLARAGCLFIISAVESLSPLVLQILDKRHTRDDVVQAIHILDAAGVVMRPTWVPFTPWATLDDTIDIYKFIDEHDLVDNVDLVQFTLRLLVPPGSLLAEHPAMLPHRGQLVNEAFSYLWYHPDPRMDRLALETAERVKASARDGEEPGETFLQLWRLAASMDGAPGPEASAQARRRRRIPRVTEPWFC